MKIVKAKLIKLETDDSLFKIENKKHKGKIYYVDLSSKKIKTGYNFEVNKQWEKELIDIFDKNINGEYVVAGFFPTELLKIFDTQKREIMENQIIKSSLNLLKHFLNSEESLEIMCKRIDNVFCESYNVECDNCLFQSRGNMSEFIRRTERSNRLLEIIEEIKNGFES